MSEFIQIGQTAIRDPITGEFLPAVPLYIRAEDQEACRARDDPDANAFGEHMLKLYQEYLEEERKFREARRKKKAR